MFFDFQDDAERLLKNCNRYDLLNDFYQSSGQWGKVGNDSSCNLFLTTGAVENIQWSSWVFLEGTLSVHRILSSSPFRNSH